MQHTDLILHGKYGTEGAFTAMAQTVGLPVAMAARLLLDGTYDIRSY